MRYYTTLILLTLISQPSKSQVFGTTGNTSFYVSIHNMHLSERDEFKSKYYDPEPEVFTGVDFGMNIQNNALSFGGLVGYERRTFPADDASKIHIVRIGGSLLYNYTLKPVEIYLKGDAGYRMIYITGNPPLRHSIFTGGYVGVSYPFSSYSIFAEIGYTPIIMKSYGEAEWLGHNAITFRLGFSFK